MTNRREFLKASAAGVTALGISTVNLSRGRLAPTAEAHGGLMNSEPLRRPFVCSTWNHGLAANETAWEILQRGGYALDAVEAGVKVTEADPTIRSVGLGGRPDRDGHVTLDACVMNETGDCGSVAYLEQIKHPVSVARLVLEQTPHVLLVGAGAQQFALDHGFTRENLLIPEVEQEWRVWREEQGFEPEVGVDNHDTISMLAVDAAGNLCGACTTSGAAYKLPGRVGDSPIIGAALFLDNEIGGACTTGLGEAVLKNLTSFLVVELMRGGVTPQAACQEAVERIVRKVPDSPDLQVGCLACNKTGEIGAYSIRPDFNYAVRDASGAELVPVDSILR
ncbi:MAG: N(4)-(beta-N-acetylglucosaminyl)-L-asparaginase [bacterium]